MVVRVDDDGYALREGSQVEIGGNERYISVSRKEFKRVFYGGERVRLFVPSDTAAESGAETEQNPLLE
jgi:thymidine kinase